MSGIGESRSDEAVISAIISESVETERQCRLLTEPGCDELRGYLPSNPLRAEEFARYLHRAEKATDSGDLARSEDAR